MKTKRLTLAVLPLLLLAAQAAHAQTPARAALSLNTGWTFRPAGRGEWRGAAVPGSVHTDLRRRLRREEVTRARLKY